MRRGVLSGKRRAGIMLQSSNDYRKIIDKIEQSLLGGTQGKDQSQWINLQTGENLKKE